MPAEAANFAMAAIQKTPAEVLAAPLAKRDHSAFARPRADGRLPGRLNLFQVAMLGWRDLHPYNAVHAGRIASPLDRDALERAIRETLTSAGLTGLELDRRRHRYAWRGGPSRIGVEVVQAGDDWRERRAQIDRPIDVAERARPLVRGNDVDHRRAHRGAEEVGEEAQGEHGDGDQPGLAREAQGEHRDRRREK